MTNPANQAPQQQQESESTPQHQHKRRLIEEAERRKKESKVIDTFIEVVADQVNPKGGKVRLCKRMKNGNLHRLYLGREKQCKDLIAKYKSNGVKVHR